MDEIDEEIKRVEEEIEILNHTKYGEQDEELPTIKEVKEKPNIKPKTKGRGQTRERMMELHKIRSEKAKLRKQEQEELKLKQQEIENAKREKINFEYEQAQKLKEAIEKKKVKKEVEKEQTPIQQAREINNSLIKSASRDILKEKYLEEAKRRVMMDLFS